MSQLDYHIKHYFDQFKETYEELMSSLIISEYIITNLTDEEKYLFYLRVVKGMTFYDIANEVGISYRLAQSSYQKISDKVWSHTKGLQNMPMDKTIDDPEFFNQEDKFIMYHDNFLNSVYLDDGVVDMTVTSPPYNVGINYGVYEDTLDYNVYLEWTKAWLSRVLQLTKDDGRLCMNVPIDCGYKDNEKATFLDMCNCARDVGWKYHGMIIWKKNHVANRAVTGTKYSAKAPITNHQSEAILVFYNKTWEKTSGTGVSTITKDEWWKLTNATWTFPGQSKSEVNHPAPFPVKLPYNCLQLFSYIDDLILDPFLGSGTTMVASALLNRRCIGFDIDANYLETAKHRVISEGQTAQGTMFDPVECARSVQQVLLDGD